MTAMGGREVLKNLHSMKLDLRVATYRLDDSERASGPYWLGLAETKEWRDENGGRYRAEAEEVSPQWTSRTIRIDDGHAVAAAQSWLGKLYWGAAPSIGDRLALSPERILLTASGAPDLRKAPPEIIEGRSCDVITFTWKGFPVKLYFDRELHLLVRLETTRAWPGDRLSAMLGDIRWRTDFLVYKQQPGGLVYPFQWNLFRNNEPYVTTIVRKLEQNAPVPAAGYSPPANSAIDLGKVTSAPYDDLPLATPASGEFLQPLAPDIWLIAGNWNVLVVRQPDGLVVIESPQSGGYSDRILTLLAERFRGVPVKAVVSATGSTWHIAGLRAYVARGIPIYALDLNIPRLCQLVANPRNLVPDTLARQPRNAVFHEVKGQQVIGSGSTRIVLYPIRGHGDERMLMAFFPEAELLYGSSNDLGSGIDQPTFNDFEIVDRVNALTLPVRVYVAIHTGPIPRSHFVDTVDHQPVQTGNP